MMNITRAVPYIGGQEENAVITTVNTEQQVSPTKLRKRLKRRRVHKSNEGFRDHET